MNTQKTILGEAVARSTDGKIIGVDITTLVQRLLLFDNVVLKSRRLVEIPDLVRAFGKTGLLDLLHSGVLKISCEFTTIAGDPVHNRVRQLPLSHFTFGLIDIADRESDFGSALSPLQGVPGLRNDDRKKMETTILEGLVRPSPSYGSDLLSQFESDLEILPLSLQLSHNNYRLTWLGLQIPSRYSSKKRNEFFG